MSSFNNTLEKIRENIANLQGNLNTIMEQQTKILERNEQMLSKLEEPVYNGNDNRPNDTASAIDSGPTIQRNLASSIVHHSRKKGIDLGEFEENWLVFYMARKTYQNQIQYKNHGRKQESKDYATATDSDSEEDKGSSEPNDGTDNENNEGSLETNNFGLDQSDSSTNSNISLQQSDINKRKYSTSNNKKTSKIYKRQSINKSPEIVIKCHSKNKQKSEINKPNKRKQGPRRLIKHDEE
ncbi:hypothetical protein INT46_003717 [Mucor plumbeus]|uniref:Uncharacterized protein n=1 Tax=Mucor plumbeus TaxID=97098 RepID=A0A8H7VAP0_9FUNG|nr:hypothetical protein INT46_003717 [Mucor plumbeus]